MKLKLESDIQTAANLFEKKSDDNSYYNKHNK